MELEDIIICRELSWCDCCITLIAKNLNRPFSIHKYKLKSYSFDDWIADHLAASPHGGAHGHPGFSGFPEAINPGNRRSARRNRYQSTQLVETTRFVYHTPGSELRRGYLPFYVTHVTHMWPFAVILILLLSSASAVEENDDQTKEKTSPDLSNGFGADIDWVGWEKAQSIAMDLDKPIFFLIHKTWCGACKSLKQNFQTSNKRKELVELSSQFVMVNVEDDDEPEDKMYSPDGGYIPRLLFLNKHGVPLDVNNEKNYPKNAYYYPLVADIVKAMKRALKQYASNKDEQPAETSEEEQGSTEKAEKDINDKAKEDSAKATKVDEEQKKSKSEKQPADKQKKEDTEVKSKKNEENKEKSEKKQGKEKKQQKKSEETSDNKKDEEKPSGGCPHAAAAKAKAAKKEQEKKAKAESKEGKTEDTKTKDTKKSAQQNKKSEL
ncbi:thioredoxin-like domain-containing protein [Ditylenchus destructor]|uniref:Thioredoxin-like domain-containing protein n=1 Tax=Ditylenchus destructor TaxID=166010 RepID=A0AAD4MWN5_9BILA|nr:thioredoxin-like domain-containing protein [Ditylenchus destructor]